MKTRVPQIAARVAVFAILGMLIAWSTALAEEETIGSDEYRISCLSCHGVGGRGDGPLAPYPNV